MCIRDRFGTFIDGAASNGTTAVNFGAQSTDSAMVTAADTLDLLVIDGGSTKTTAWRFRAHVVLVDVSKNPVESATVSTGT